MWIQTRYGFFSIVQSQEDKSKFMIRARRKEHLAALKKFAEKEWGLLKKAVMKDTLERDYRYRFIVPKEEAVAVLTTLGNNIDYGNFKEAVAKMPLPILKGGFINFLHRIWALGFDMQERK